MNYKDIETEFDKVFIMPPYFKPTIEEPIYDLEKRKEEVKLLAKKISNQIIGDMIEEERPHTEGKETDSIWVIHEKGFNLGYNQKIKELKEFKKRFNQ